MNPYENDPPESGSALEMQIPDPDPVDIKSTKYREKHDDLFTTFLDLFQKR